MSLLFGKGIFRTWAISLGEANLALTVLPEVVQPAKLHFSTYNMIHGFEFYFGINFGHLTIVFILFGGMLAKNSKH